MKYQYRSFIISPSGTVEQMITPKAPSLETLQTAVGGWIETVPYFTEFAGRTRGTAFANEEGILHDLPINSIATAAWRACFPAATILYGPVIIYFRERTE